LYRVDPLPPRKLYSWDLEDEDEAANDDEALPDTAGTAPPRDNLASLRFGE
jgi:hypothetical protein